MLLELTGRLDPGELWARIDVPENVLPPRGFGLELLDLVACADGDHADDHFEAHPVSDYPPRRGYKHQCATSFRATTGSTTPFVRQFFRRHDRLCDSFSNDMPGSPT